MEIWERKISNMLNSVSRQFGNPHGVLGEIVGYILAFNNRDRTQWLISEMNVKPEDEILEIGCGPGAAIKSISSVLTRGSVTGIDISEVMTRQALKRNAVEVQSGKVRLILGTVDDLNKKERFDKIFGINVHIFWKNPVEEIIKLKSFLKDTGQLILALQPRFAKKDEDVIKEAEKTKEYYRKAGIKIVRSGILPMKPQAVFYVAGIK